MTKFTEDFDFTAMNEKFNKDEVWGNLGKNKTHLKDNDGVFQEDETYDTLEEDDDTLNKITSKVRIFTKFFFGFYAVTWLYILTSSFQLLPISFLFEACVRKG